MANKIDLDFNCPRYVDFIAGIESNSDDVSFDCEGFPSPLDGIAHKNPPAPAKGLTKEVEDRLVDKMTSALSIINTPKLKTGIVRGKLFSEKGPLKNVASHPVKPGKTDNVSTQPSRVRSKSVCMRAEKINKGKKVRPKRSSSLSELHAEKINKAKKVRPKRSSSLSDLRTIKKQHTYAKTPLCLKRTINSKAKPKTLKTSEEIELEQIAILQKELSQLLRNNEISYKRLIQKQVNRKQKSCVQKTTESKTETSKGNPVVNTNRNTRRDFHAMNHTAMKKEALKLDSIINDREASSKAETNIPKDILEKSNIPSVSSSIISEDCDRSDRNRTHSSKKPVKYGFHSGLVFHDTFKKSTIVKPFSFDVKIKEKIAQKSEASHSGKENIPVTRAKAIVKKLMDQQNVKKEIKILGSSKKIGHRYENPVRGLPLSENFLRN